MQIPNIFTRFSPKIILTISLVKSKLSTAKKFKTAAFSRVFHSNFFFFWQFFSWNQSCQQLKSPKPQHFHEFFTPKNLQFSREIKVEFLDTKWRFRTVCKMGKMGDVMHASIHLNTLWYTKTTSGGQIIQSTNTFNTYCIPNSIFCSAWHIKTFIISFISLVYVYHTQKNETHLGDETTLVVLTFLSTKYQKLIGFP